ncbi:hypothetical protein [Streptomyces sp. AcE210]|uniref:hypothetical protein n=1 Tax=Streptomyces sp. AcE210 TaxID=2292703 RepID=UPI000E304046|nr:hypothetical protein [Streptomyces sp. AcE210]RFC75163.1 hypothetical protein DXZ75_19370 [Streptomyces sp. AcE210]
MAGLAMAATCTELDGVLPPDPGTLLLPHAHPAPAAAGAQAREARTAWGIEDVDAHLRSGAAQRA